MEVLILRVALPAMTILLITAMQRRLGHRLGGRMVGLPLTTCPFLAILLLTDGRTATSQAAAGAAAGQLGVVAFCLGYGRLGHRLRNPVAAVAAILGLAAVALALVSRIGSTPVVAVLAVVAAATGLMMWPPVAAPTGTANPGRWDLPVRVFTTVSIVVCLTGSARVLGPHLAGLLACTPVGMWVLALSTHRNSGFRAAASLLRGALWSAPGTLAFALTMAYGVRPWGALAFGPALVGLFVTDFLFRRLVAWCRDTLRPRIFAYRVIWTGSA